MKGQNGTNVNLCKDTSSFHVALFLAVVLLYFEIPVQGSVGQDVKIEDYTRKIKQDPENAEWYALRGVQYLNGGHLKPALLDLQKAKTLKPDDKELDWAFSRYYTEAKEWDKAIKYLTRVIQRDSSLLLPKLYRARAYKANHQVEKAWQDYMNIFKSDHHLEPEQYIEISNYMNEWNKPEDALKVLDHAMNKKGEVYSLQRAKVDVFLSSKSYEKAQSLLNHMMKGLRVKHELLEIKGDVYLKMKQETTAMQMYNEALNEIKTLKKSGRILPHFKNTEKILKEKMTALKKNEKEKP